jgi:hypothetical protein
MNTNILRGSLSSRFFATATVVAVFASVEAPLRHFTSVRLASLPVAQLKDSAAAYEVSTLHAEWLLMGQSALTALFALAVLCIWAPAVAGALGGALAADTAEPHRA